MRFLARLLVTALAVGAATWLVAGIRVTGESDTEKALTLVAVAAILGLVNAIVRPVVKLLALPLYVLTLGLVLFVINALMLRLTSWFAGQLELGFAVDGFWPAFWGALVVSIVSLLLSWLVPDD